MEKFKLIITFICETNGEAYDCTEIYRTKEELKDLFCHPESYGYNSFFYHRRTRLTRAGKEITYKCEAYTD